MKKIITSLTLLLFTIGIWAQSEQLFTHFMFNKLNYNPAFAGAKDGFDAAAIYRNQWWSGVEGHPRTLNVFAHTPFAGDRNGIGLSILQDELGLHTTTSVGIQYAYRIPINDKNKLSVGLSPRFESVRADWSKAIVNDAIDNSIGRPLFDGEETNSTFNLGAGLFFTNPNFYLGLSVPRILKNSLYYDEDEFSSQVNTYYLMGGLILPLTANGSVKFYPNAMVSYNSHVPFEFDINANFLLQDALWLGISYRYEDSIDGLIQYYFDNGLRVGFAIDFTTSELNRATTGSFEVLVGYTLPTRHIVNLRYF